MRSVHAGPLVGLLATVVLVGGLAATVGLSFSAWVVSLGCAGLVAAALTRGLARSGGSGLGPADLVTSTRATLTCGVAALTVTSFGRPASVPALVTLSVVALVLDNVDGRVARRTGTSSALGARFDMEVDAFLILVLSVFVSQSTGAWVLAIGGARYGFVAARWGFAWMRGDVPPRYWCKVVAAVQGVVLTIAAAAVLPPPVTTLALVGALALLAESFGREVCWLWANRKVRSSPVLVSARAG